MKPEKIFLAAAAILSVMVAQAARVDASGAKAAAWAWTMSGAGRMGSIAGSAPEGAVEYASSEGGSFYAVKMASGGTVFVSSDDTFSPVIAFTGNPSPDLSVSSPLRILLDRDAAVRARYSAKTPLSDAKKTKSAAAWKRLSSVSAGMSAADSKILASASPISSDESITDLRVAPIVKSQWSQTTANGQICYNYYTPGHYPCGCTATAASQIMRYFRYPDFELPQRTYEIEVNGTKQEADTIGDSRLYDWDLMTLIPDNGVDEANREMIGRLTYDVGIALESNYAPGGTGASPDMLADVYVNSFGYKSAYAFFDDSGFIDYTLSGRETPPSTGLHEREVRNKILYTNLDAGHPVQFGIYSISSGHSVVADGYGFVTAGGEELEYVHINMGWAGSDDLWYNIPDINAANTGASSSDAGMDFNCLAAATYNIFTNETGAILSGRVIDDEEPVEGALVTVMNSTGAELATALSDEHGIYAFILPAGTYSVSATSPDGKKMDLIDDIELSLPSVNSSEPYYNYVNDSSKVGNSWGNDLDLTLPSVRIGTKLYTRLDKALADANGMDAPLVEIIEPTKMRNPVTVFTNMTITATNSVPSETSVMVEESAVTSGGWIIQIYEGAQVLFTNVVFETAASPACGVDVCAGATAALSGTLSLGTLYLGDENAILLESALSQEGLGVNVYPRWSAVKGSKFGTYSCSYADAAATAALMANTGDPTLACTADEESGTLVFDRIEVDPSIAYAWISNGTEAKYYRSFDMMLDDYPNGGRIVLMQDCPPETFTKSVKLGADYSFESGEGGPYTLDFPKNAGFEVPEGTGLSVSNVTFTCTAGAVVSPLVSVTGGKFAMQNGASIKDIVLAGTASAVDVKSGEIEMLEGSSISGCTAVPRNASGQAAAVYLSGENASFSFKGGEITGCIAGNAQGGAVYAGSRAKVYVEGTARCKDNSSGAKSGTAKPSDIYLSGNDADGNPLLVLSGETSDYIGVYYYGSDAAGKTFASVAPGVSAASIEESLKSFFSSRNAKLVASAGSSGTLVWQTDTTFPREAPETAATAKIEDSTGEHFYAYVGDAFFVATNGPATVSLLKDDVLTNGVKVLDDIVLEGGGHTVSRNGPYPFGVTNVIFEIRDTFLDGNEANGRMIDVYGGGELVLGDGATIANVMIQDKSGVAPVVVKGGIFTMLSGSRIFNCRNTYVEPEGGALNAGAAVVDGLTGYQAKANLRGGTVEGCFGSRAGGIYIGNTATIDVKGDATVRNNTSGDGTAGLNLVVQDLSALTLVDDLDGTVWYTEGYNGSTNVFGNVDASYAASASPSNLVASARRFRRDATGDKGVPVQSADKSETLLVWASAVGDATVFTNTVDGVEKTYDVVVFDIDDDPEVVECLPFTFTSIEQTGDGTWHLVLKPGVEFCKYTLYSSGDLETWTQEGQPRVLSDDDLTDALEFYFDVNDASGRRFWKVTGEDGEK